MIPLLERASDDFARAVLLCALLFLVSAFTGLPERIQADRAFFETLAEAGE